MGRKCRSERLFHKLFPPVNNLEGNKDARKRGLVLPIWPPEYEDASETEGKGALGLWVRVRLAKNERPEVWC